MNIIKKVECKHCKVSANLYIIEHPAKWTYFLCKDCMEGSKDGHEQNKSLNN